MKIKHLNKLASWFFHNNCKTHLKNEIYDLTEGCHPADSVKKELSEELNKFIEGLKEITKTVKEFKAIAKEIRNSNHKSELAKRISKLVKDVDLMQKVTLQITLEEWLVFESL